jgi:hypothetical protein
MMAHNDHALIVGISYYPGISDLEGPEEDALRFKEWLLQPDGGAVPAEHIEWIVSSNYNRPSPVSHAQPICHDIDRYLQGLVNLGKTQGIPIGRRLYIFLAGHGFAPDPDEAALLMANTELLAYNHHIAGRRYGTRLRTAALFEEIIVLMDCCGSFVANTPIREPGFQAPAETSGGRVKFFYGFASDFAREAREGQCAETGTVMGFFTQALLAGLKYAPREQGGLTISSLRDYIKQFLHDRLQDQEYPEPRFAGPSPVEFYLLQNNHVPINNVRITFEQAQPGENVQILGAQLSPVAETIVQNNVWEVPLNVGMYLLQVKTDVDRSLRFSVLGGELDVTF